MRKRAFTPAEADWTFYPNPAQHTFTIQNRAGRPLALEIADPAGRVMKSLTVPEGRREYPLDLPAGLYFIRERQSGSFRRLVVE